jgi:hypothetical protein
VRVGEADFGFASDALYNFDSKDGALRATVCRATPLRHDGPGNACHTKALARRPGLGRTEVRFVLAPGDEELPRRSLELTQPPVAVAVVPAKGPWERSGSL